MNDPSNPKVSISEMSPIWYLLVVSEPTATTTPAKSRHGLTGAPGYKPNAHKTSRKLRVHAGMMLPWLPVRQIMMKGWLVVLEVAVLSRRSNLFDFLGFYLIVGVLF